MHKAEFNELHFPFLLCLEPLDAKWIDGWVAGYTLARMSIDPLL